MPEPRNRRLIKNTIIISIGKICTSIITFLLLPLYTTILNTEEYGIVDLLDTLMALLLPIIGLQLEQGAFRELLENRKNRQKEREIISTGFFVTLIQCIIFIPPFIFISPFVHNDYLFFLLINVLACVVVNFLQQTARGLDKINEYTIGSFINAAGTIVFNVVLLVIFKLGIYGMLLGTFGGFCITLFYYFFSLHFFSYASLKLLKKSTLKTLLRYSIPLIPNTLAWWIFSASDRVIVSSILGLDANGILAASLKFPSIITTIYNIFHISWIESISLAIKDKDAKDYFNRTFNIVLKLFTSLSFSVIVLTPFVFPLLINANFDKAYNLIPISVIAVIFNIISGLVSAVYIAKRNTKTIAHTSIFSAIINIIVHLSLIHLIGLYAAAISTLVTYVTLSVYRIFDAKKKYFKITFDKKFIELPFVTAIFILISYYIDNIFINVLSILIAIMFAIIVNKSSLTFIKNIVKQKLFKERSKL